MKLELINIGRHKICKIIEIKKPSFNKVYNHVKKHLLSKEIDIVETDTEGVYDVFVGGMRNVGQIKVDQPQYMVLL